MMTRRLMIVSAMLAVPFIAPLAADEPKDNPAVKLLNRDIARHKQFLKIVEKGEGDVIFLGDSITQGWEGAGKKAWADNFTPLKAVNLGIGGDQTGHILWRIHGQCSSVVVPPRKGESIFFPDRIEKRGRL